MRIFTFSVSLFFQILNVKAAILSFTVPSLAIHVRQLLGLEQAVYLPIKIVRIFIMYSKLVGSAHF